MPSLNFMAAGQSSSNPLLRAIGYHWDKRQADRGSNVEAKLGN
jgi:hypothetical protein